ncbi:hypothetical protein SDC9_27710 [bioreactor metagenome]|uniref:Uncharacterized protein n=1 Tax=bioreactor metagenome TaxID=1076179 RepID=A0A644URU6_9ZZZZ
MTIPDFDSRNIGKVYAIDGNIVDYSIQDRKVVVIYTVNSKTCIIGIVCIMKHAIVDGDV